MTPPSTTSKPTTSSTDQIVTVVLMLGALVLLAGFVWTAPPPNPCPPAQPEHRLTHCATPPRCRELRR